MMDSGLSVADAIALRDDNGGNNGNNGFGDGNGWWVMFLFFLLAWSGGNGWGLGNGNGGAGMQGVLTRSDLCQDMNFSDLESGVRGLQQGLCDGFYAMNTGMLNGFAGVDNAICNLGYNVQQGINSVNTNMMQGNFAIQQAINADTVANMQNTNALQAQLAQCCCDNRAGLKDIQYTLATNNCAVGNAISQAARDIVDNQNANYRALHDEIVANRIEDKNAIIASQNQQIFQYQLAASQAGQTMDIKNGILTELRNCPVGTYPVPNPNCCYGANVTFGNPYNNNCGCNNGCGC